MTHRELNEALVLGQGKGSAENSGWFSGASDRSQEQDSITQMPLSLGPSLILWSFFWMAHSTCYCHGISALFSPCSRTNSRLPQQPSGLQEEGEKSNSPNKIRPQGFAVPQYSHVLMSHVHDLSFPCCASLKICTSLSCTSHCRASFHLCRAPGAESGIWFSRPQSQPQCCRACSG